MASGIKYTSEVLNQRGAPALFEDILTNRPAAGFVGRLFFATDVTSGNTIFRDNGTTWDALAGNGGGGGGGVTTLSNGLTLTGSNGTLGGTLTQNTTITGNSFDFTANGFTTVEIGGGSSYFRVNSFNAITGFCGGASFYGNANKFYIGDVFGTAGTGTQFQVEGAAQQFIFTNGNVLIGSGVSVPSSIFTATSTTQGALLPRMTTTQRNAITSPATGLLVYDTTLLLLYQYDGTAWAAVGGASTNIYNTNGSLTSARTLTLNSQPLTIAGTTSSRFFANGNVAIGTTTDSGYTFTVSGTTNLIRLLSSNGNAQIQSQAGNVVNFLSSVQMNLEASSYNYVSGNLRTYVGVSSAGTVSTTIFGSTAAPDATAIVQINSTTKGALLPRMTTAQINAIVTPAEGLIIYNTTLSNLCCYQAGVWVKFSHSPM